jgi:hypothetical protein
MGTSKASRSGVGRRDERGQILPLAAAGMVAVFACVALAVDVGAWRYQQRQAQTAADSAAISGAAELNYSAAAGSIQTAAYLDAKSNGFDHSASGVTVTVNSPPSSGNYKNDAKSVEVIIEKTQSGFFSKMYNLTPQVGARAVAQLSPSNVGCVFALNPAEAPYTFQVTGGGFSVNGCAVIDDGTFNATGGTSTASAFDVSGAIDKTKGVTPAPTSAPAQADPCPALAPCAYLTANPPATSPCGTGSNGGTNVNASGTIGPGVYCNGLKISGGTVTMNPGLYVITGGNGGNNGLFTVTGGTVNGSGVSFYIASAAQSGTASGASVAMTGGTMNFTPLSTAYSYNKQAGGTGTLPTGLLFYQPSANTNQMKLTGGGGSVACPAASPDFSGVFYMPGALLDITGGGVWDPSIIITGGINVTGGTATPCITSAGPGTQIARAGLVE